MNKLTVLNLDAKVLSYTDIDSEITDILGSVGVDFFQWSADEIVNPHDGSDKIMKAYKTQIDSLISKNGYSSVDVVNMHPEHPEKKEFRKKFLSEHTHCEDEVRFFVKGEGLFSMKIDSKVYSVLCKQGDLISVPANTPHWFDMGASPDFVAIRLFNNPDGWVANFSGSDIADKFPRID